MVTITDGGVGDWETRDEPGWYLSQGSPQLEHSDTAATIKSIQTARCSSFARFAHNTVIGANLKIRRTGQT